MTKPLPNPRPLDVMARRRRIANRAVSQSMMEMAVAEPGMVVGDAAYLIAREAACQLLAYRGPTGAAEALYQLADELVGAK